MLGRLTSELDGLANELLERVVSRCLLLVQGEAGLLLDDVVVLFRDKVGQGTLPFLTILVIHLNLHDSLILICR